MVVWVSSRWPRVRPATATDGPFDGVTYRRALDAGMDPGEWLQDQDDQENGGD